MVILYIIMASIKKMRLFRGKKTEIDALYDRNVSKHIMNKSEVSYTNAIDSI